MIERLVKGALKHKLSILIIFLAICILGSWALFSLPIDAFPDISPNLVQVFGEVDGMAAEEIETLVKNANASDNWDNILVTERFTPHLVKNCEFYGLVRIGRPKRSTSSTTTSASP